MATPRMTNDNKSEGMPIFRMKQTIIGINESF